MNEINQTLAATRRHPGRLYLLLGILLPLAGIAIYFFQLQAKILRTPWYMPIMATIGVLLIVLALAQSRSVVRWLAMVVFTLFAALEWVALLLLANVPAYAGPAKAGQPFPDFSTTQIDGRPFTQDNLKGQSTVMVFFRGRW